MNAMMPKTIVISPVQVMTEEASRFAFSFSPCARKEPKMGMNADPKAPDIMTRNSRSGIRNALTYASYSPVVPNLLAITISRMSPSTRLATAAMPTIAALRANVEVDRMLV